MRGQELADAIVKVFTPMHSDTRTHRPTHGSVGGQEIRFALCGVVALAERAPAEALQLTAVQFLTAYGASACEKCATLAAHYG